MSTPFTFQNATPYNNASLLGAELSTATNNSLLVYFAPTGSYDGTAALQFSPDGGTTWFALPIYDVTSAIGTAVYSVASPSASKCYVAPIPVNTLVRVLMSGGSMGALSAYGLLTSYLAQ